MLSSTLTTREQPAASSTETAIARATSLAPARGTDREEEGFRLLVERGGAAHASEVAALAVGSTPSALVLTVGADPQLLDADAPDAAGATIWLEPIQRDQRSALLLVAVPGSRARVNDLPLPPVCVLDVGDALQIAGALLHVSWYRAPLAGPPPAHVIGVSCALCSVPVSEETTIVVHTCGQPLHHEDDENGLRCALLGDCPHCQEAVSLECGLTYHPFGDRSHR